MKATLVYLERGAKKTFAAALDWPGWCRAAKTDELALDALAEYVDRYAIVVTQAGLTVPSAKFDVVEELRGNATTDFGAPAAIASADHDRLTTKQADRLAAILESAWTVFDDVVAHAPASLRKGPRGGGRDRDKIVAHVSEAQEAYARKLGLKLASRDDIAGAIRAARDGAPLKDKGWPPRYAARRIAWHVLDHAWEIEDRRA